MLKKPVNYDEVQVNDNFTPLELGGHKGVIMKVEEYTSEYSGLTSLRVVVDTANDDKQPEYFTELYKSDDREDKKWSNSAIKYVSLKEDENCVKMLKSFITAVENSNPGFSFNWDKELDQLKGKKVGLVFGLEEYEDSEGNVKAGRKLVQFRSIDKVDHVTIPKVRLVDGSFIDYDLYQEREESKSESPDSVVEVVVDDKDLPF